MIGYTLKQILELVPQALPLVKQASVELDYPTDSRDNCIASGLVVGYKQGISGQTVDLEVMDKVATAMLVYNVEEVVSDLVKEMYEANKQKLVKQASQNKDVLQESYKLKEFAWENQLSGFVDLQGIIKQAEELAREAAQIDVKPSGLIDRYSGNAYLSKEAALDALGARFYATKNDVFVKIAAALSNEADVIAPGKLVKDLCSTVTKFDKEAGLDLKGFNFYKETLVEKSAAYNSMLVKIAGVNYSLTKVLALPDSYVDDYLGKGFMKQANSDPASAKAMIESLPLDSQHVLATILKNSN